MTNDSELNKNSSGGEGTEIDSDDAILMQMGYKQELHRGLTAFGNFAFGFTEVAVLSSFASVFGYGLATGGIIDLFNFNIFS